MSVLSYCNISPNHIWLPFPAYIICRNIFCLNSNRCFKQNTHYDKSPCLYINKCSCEANKIYIYILLKSLNDKSILIIFTALSLFFNMGTHLREKTSILVKESIQVGIHLENGTAE